MYGKSRCFPKQRLFMCAGLVSRVLCPGSLPGLRHLSTTAVACRLQQPTPRHRTSSPSLSVYTVLQPAGRTAGRHRCPRGRLLPHLFTLTGRKPGRRSFSVTLPCPLGHQVVSLRGALRCPDFPPPACAGSDGAGLRGKGRQKIHNAQFIIHNYLFHNRL